MTICFSVLVLWVSTVWGLVWTRLHPHGAWLAYLCQLVGRWVKVRKIRLLFVWIWFSCKYRYPCLLEPITPCHGPHIMSAHRSSAVALHLAHISCASPALVCLPCQTESEWTELTGFQKLLCRPTDIWSDGSWRGQTAETLMHQHQHHRRLVLCSLMSMVQILRVWHQNGQIFGMLCFLSLWAHEICLSKPYQLQGIITHFNRVSLDCC